MKKFYLKAFLPVILLLVGGATALAQSTVSGTVKDGTSSETLAGVNIIVKGRVAGTISDTNGQFNLKVAQSPPFTLSFSFIGFKTQEIEIKDANTTGLDLVMEEQLLLGQEVVVSASRDRKSVV